MTDREQHIKRCLYLSEDLTQVELKALYMNLYLNERFYKEAPYPIETCYPERRDHNLLFRFVFWQDWHLRAVLKAISDKMDVPMYLDFENDCIQ